MEHGAPEQALHRFGRAHSGMQVVVLPVRMALPSPATGFGDLRHLACLVRAEHRDDDPSACGEEPSPRAHGLGGVRQEVQRGDARDQVE